MDDDEAFFTSGPAGEQMFLIPTLLLGGFLATIPILIHMVRRQKIVPLPWGAMQFLLETPLKSRRRRNIDQWLLLLTRMAVLACLAVALARPITKSSAAATTSPMDVVVVLDHSLSMGRRTTATADGGSRTLFEAGIDTMEKVARLLPSSGAMGVVLAEHVPRVLTQVPLRVSEMTGGKDAGATSDWRGMLQQLRQVHPGATDARIADSVRAAEEVAARGSNSHKIILIISDQQAGNWDVGDNGVWDAVKHAGDTAVWSVGLPPESSVGNIAVSDIHISPSFVVVQRPAEITVSVANTGGTSMDHVPLELSVDGQVAGRQEIAHLEAGKSETIRFDHYFVAAGSHWVRVRARVVDGLEADNETLATTNVASGLRTLVIDGQVGGRSFPAAEYLRLAMQPSGNDEDTGTSSIVPHVASIADVDDAALDTFSVIVLNDVPRVPTRLLQHLKQFVESGKGLWIILGNRTQPVFVSGTLANSGLLSGTLADTKGARSLSTPANAEIRAPENAAVALVTSVGKNALAGAAVRKYWPLTATGTGVQTVLTIAGGDPLMTEMPVGSNGGRVILWTTAAGDLSWNNLPLVPNFVPLVNETLFSLATGGSASDVRAVEAGASLVWTGPAGIAVQSATVVNPDGSAHRVPLQVQGGRSVLGYRETFNPGVYAMHFEPDSIPQPVYYAVTLDHAELNPTLLSPQDVSWLQEHNAIAGAVGPNEIGKALAAKSAGNEWWWLLGFVTVLLLVCEAYLTSKHAKEQRAADPASAGILPPEVVSNFGGMLR